MRRIGLALVAAGAITAAGGATAQAAQLNGCTGSRSPWNDGSGSCPAQTTPTAPFTAREPTTVRFSGSGTSDSLGICSGSLLVTNLKLSVTMTYTGAVSGTTLVEHQIWSAPVTTFPLATAFLITGDGGPPAIGAGLAITHIYLQCGNGGNSPSANFAWAESP
ncbi:MAG: hypothetical protein E6G41_14960 [Actinobacteria bacterium]|nr:MAG: hypothetical protein E6G41_14960 [Actinomycetota bacterium]